MSQEDYKYRDFLERDIFDALDLKMDSDWFIYSTLSDIPSLST